MIIESFSCLTNIRPSISLAFNIENTEVHLELVLPIGLDMRHFDNYINFKFLNINAKLFDAEGCCSICLHVIKICMKSISLNHNIVNFQRFQAIDNEAISEISGSQ